MRDAPSGLARLSVMPLQSLSDLGLSYAEVLRTTRLDGRQLGGPDPRTPRAAVARLCQAISAQATYPAIGPRLSVACHVRDPALVRTGNRTR